MHCNFYRGITDDVSFFLHSLWVCAGAHLPHPIAIHKTPWHLLVEFILNTTIHALYTFACVRIGPLASKEDEPKLPFYH